jgi:aspartate aminotransferase
MSERAEALRASGVDVITLAAGEPEAATAEHVVAAAVAAARTASTHHYGTAAGHPALRALIAAQAAAAHRVDISASDVQVTVGTKHALHLAVRAVTQPGDEVLTVRPGWPGHRECIESADARAVMVDTDDRFLIDTAALRAARTDRTRALILANPANLTGALHTADRLASIAAWCLDNDVWLICDEIYDAFIYEGVAVHALAAAPRAAHRIIVVNGVSKVHAMTGWRVGWLFGPKEVVDSAREQLGRTITHVPQLTQIAALAALGDHATPAHAVNAYRCNRDMLVQNLDAIPGINCPIPGGGMFAFPDVSGLLEHGRWSSTNDLADWLLTHPHVAVVAGQAFGSERHLRLNFTLSSERLHQAAHRLVSALT